MAQFNTLPLSRRQFLKLTATAPLLFPVCRALAAAAPEDVNAIPDRAVRDAVTKARDFDHDFTTDRYVNKQELAILQSTLNRLERLQRLVGYANFNLLGFDESLRYANNYSAVGGFSSAELAFIEEIFATDSRLYGFFGEKTARGLTDTIAEHDVIKLGGSGHYLYRGEAHATFRRLQRDVGPQLQLTSGIRSVVKQLHLFLAKVSACNGNLSRAARQLAPPGHSFHGIGDFDVGQFGLGAANFTDQFAQCEVYRRVHALGYSSIRYPQTNPYGVRYEPWHIKVVKHA